MKKSDKKSKQPSKDDQKDKFVWKAGQIKVVKKPQPKDDKQDLGNRADGQSAKEEQ